MRGQWECFFLGAGLTWKAPECWGPCSLSPTYTIKSKCLSNLSSAVISPRSHSCPFPSPSLPGESVASHCFKIHLHLGLLSLLLSPFPVWPLRATAASDSSPSRLPSAFSPTAVLLNRFSNFPDVPPKSRASLPVASMRWAGSCSEELMLSPPFRCLAADVFTREPECTEG